MQGAPVSPRVYGASLITATGAVAWMQWHGAIDTVKLLM